jgi:sulfur-carrier protein
VPVTVKVPTLLRDHVGGASTVEANGGRTLREVLDALDARYPGLKERIVTDDGQLHRFVNVYVNDEDVRHVGALDAPVAEGDTVAILPAVAGGCPPSRAHQPVAQLNSLTPA